MTEEQKIIPFHSDLHRDITLWLQDNRHLSPEERFATIKATLEDEGLDNATLLHYAACGFTAFDALLVQNQKLPGTLKDVTVATKNASDRRESELKTNRGIMGADALHGQPGGSRDKRKLLLEIWASGQYKTKVKCATDECDRLCMSFDTARKTLIGAPKPNIKK